MTNLGCGRQSMRRTVSTGQFTCHNQECESHAEPTKATYRVLQDSDWLRVFYVPLIPVSQGEQLVECDMCGAIVTVATCHNSADTPAVPFVVDPDSRLEITARPAPQAQPQSIRLVVGAPAGDPVIAPPPGVRQPIRACVDKPSAPMTTSRKEAVSPAPPQRPSRTSCGLCGTGRAPTDEICVGCGAVFTDRSVRSCVRHRIALPAEADCPVCGPDGVHELEPAMARSSFFT